MKYNVRTQKQLFISEVQRLTCAQITKLWLIRRPQTLVGRAKGIYLCLGGRRWAFVSPQRQQRALSLVIAVQREKVARTLLSSRAVMKLIKFVSAECRLIKH